MYDYHINHISHKDTKIENKEMYQKLFFGKILEATMLFQKTSTMRFLFHITTLSFDRAVFLGMFNFLDKVQLAAWFINIELK